MLLWLSAVGLPGQSTERSADISERDLAHAVVVDARTGKMTIRHPRSGVSVSDARLTVLEYAAFVPSAQEVTVAECRPENLRPFINLVAHGSYGNVPIVRLEVDLIGLRISGVAVPDEFFIRLQWSTPMRRGRLLQPPLGPLVVNPAWQPSYVHRTRKYEEKPLDFTNPSSWYHNARSFVRLETFRDGVAKVAAESILPLTPFGALDSIALFWRGVQQPVHIVDADSSSTLTSGDIIYFVGRRPAGDSTYLDESDTSSIFYLTGTHRGTERLRLRQNDSPLSDSIIFALQRRVLFELDTGYFHPGSGPDDDLGYLYTPKAALEGFYWTSLNARSQQSGHYLTSFIPARNDSPVSYSATIATTSDSKAYDPDHAVDVVFPGLGEPQRLEVNGYGTFIINGNAKYWDIPPVPASVHVQATGFPERISSNDWSSLVLVDAIEVRGQGASIVEHGRLDGYVKLDRACELIIDNLPDNSPVVIDTLRSEIGFPVINERKFQVRAARWPYRNPAKPLVVVDGQYSLGVVIGDDHVHTDSLRSFATVAVDRITLRPVLRLHETAEELIKVIQQADTSLPLVIVQARGKLEVKIMNALFDRGVVLDTALLGDDGWIGTTQGRICNSTDGVLCHLSGWPNARAANAEARLSLSDGEHYLVIGAGGGVETAKVSPATNAFLSLRDWSQGADVIAITHREHAAEAKRWAAHREQFSRKQVVTVDVDDVFEAYGAGRHDPRAVRTFLRDAWQRSGARKPTHCVLIGSASWDARRAVSGGNVDAVRVDQIPTYGRPSSDMWFGLLDDEHDLATPELIVTRFPGSVASETAALVDKIITYDTVPYAPYQRRFLYGGGGKEGDNFCDIVNRLLSDEFGTGVVFVEPPLCLDTVVVCAATSDHPGREMRQAIASGVGWINFLGHGGTEEFDIADWEAPQLTNVGRYPILATYSCLTGSYSSPSATCENAKYLFEPLKGSVASIGSSGLQYISAAEFLHYRIHETLLSTSLRDLGQIVYEAKSSFSRTNSVFALNTSMQFGILGDPFTRVHIDTTAELSVAADRMRLTTLRGGTDQIVDDDSTMIIRAEVWNHGLATKFDVDLRLIRTFNDRADTITLVVERGFCRQTVAEFRLPIGGMAGLHTLTLTVDPQRRIGDNLANNSVTVRQDVRLRSLIILEPDAFEVIDPASAAVRVIDVLSAPGHESDLNVEFAVCSAPDTTTMVIRSQSRDVRRAVTGAPSLVDWSLADVFRADSLRTYWIGAWPKQRPGQPAVQIAWQPVVLLQGAADPERHRLLPDVLDGGNRKIIDAKAGGIILPRYPVPVTVLSGGKPTADPVRQPYMSIRVRDNIILENSFRQGLNIAVFAPYDTVPRAVRRFDTSPNASPVEAGHSGYAREFIRFVRDSIKAHEIIALVACDESFTRFKRDSLMDELKRQLQDLGARKADSLQISASYVLVGSKSNKDQPYAERISTSGSIVSSTVDIQFTDSLLTLPLPPLLIGRWSGLSIKATGNAELTLQRRSPSGVDDTLTIDSAQWQPQPGYSYAPASLRLRASEREPFPVARSIDLRFAPRPQVVVASGMIEPDRPTRGDTLGIKIRLVNARRAHGSVSAPLSLSIQDTAAGELVRQNRIRSVAQQSFADETFVVASESLPQRYRVLATVDQESTLPLRHRVFTIWQGAGTVAEDTSAPFITLMADGVPCSDGLYVQRAPLFEVLVSDSCRLPIESEDNLTVFVNGNRIRRDNVQQWEFIGTAALLNEPGYNTDARAVLRFQFPMESGENLVIMRARDVSGNADTAEISLFLTERSAISHLLVYPNPGTRQSAFTVQFDAALADSTAGVRVATYDMQGRLFGTRRVQVSSGRTSIKIDPVAADYVLGPGVYTIVVELLAIDGKTLSTLTRNLLVTP